MRLTFQDETIETLNQTITAQWKQIDALTRQLAELKERLQDAESNAAGPSTNGRRIIERANKNGLRKGGRSSQTQRRSIALALDDDPCGQDRNRGRRLDHDGLVAIAIAVLTLADHFTVAIAVAMAGTDGHADARRTNADANTDFFRTRRLNERKFQPPRRQPLQNA